MSTIHELPDDIAADNRADDSGIVLYHYRSARDSFHEKSVMKQHAFSLVISGAKTMHFSETTVYIRDHRVHLLSAGHCIASVDFAQDQPFESVLVFFDQRVWLDFCAAHAGLVEAQQGKAANTQSYIEFEKDEWMAHYIQSLVLALGQGRPPSAAMKKLKLQELLLHLQETQPRQLLSFRHAQTISAVELRIRKVMEANMEHHLGIEELAFLCHLSVSGFKRHFKKIYGGSPMEWHHQQRMKLAARLLHHEKPGDIWHKLGFDTHTGFTKSFRKYYGVSPSEYAGSLARQEDELNRRD